MLTLESFEQASEIVKQVTQETKLIKSSYFSDLTGRQTPDLIIEKVASMSCKAAVKGNDKLSLPEINELIDELLSLDNPYNCPHGRPTIISMSKYEIERKFSRK